jgi:hypothetical protein
VIGYYVHHLGRGHLEMARCIAARLDEHVTGLSSLSRPRDWPGDWLKLPRDDTGGSAIEPTARGQLHWGSAVITLVAGRHAHLALHRRGLLASSVRPDLHVLVAMNSTAERRARMSWSCAAVRAQLWRELGGSASSTTATAARTLTSVSSRPAAGSS